MKVYLLQHCISKAFKYSNPLHLSCHQSDTGIRLCSAANLRVVFIHIFFPPISAHRVDTHT